MLTRVLATSVERFPGRRRDTSGLLELALGVLDAFRRQMERAAHKPAPLLISAEESITVDQPELKTGSGADGSIAYAVRQQQHLGKRRSRKPTGGFTSSKSEIIEVSDNSDGAKTAGKTDRHGGGAYPAAYGARSSQAEEECGDNFSTDQRQAAGAFVAGTVSTASMCGGD